MIKVVEIGNKGLIVKYKNSVKGFIPLSHVANKFIKDEDLQGLSNQDLQVEVIDVEPRKRRLILQKNVVAREENVETGRIYQNVSSLKCIYMVLC